MILAGLKKAVEERIGRLWSRGKFGMELRGNEIRVDLGIKLTNFHSLATTICVTASEKQTNRLKGRHKRWIHLVAMAVSLHHTFFTVNHPGNAAIFQYCFSAVIFY